MSGAFSFQELTLWCKANSMIAVPTLLILGAGASIPYGFPSGADLTQALRTVAAKKQSGVIQRICECGHDEFAVMDFLDSFFRSRLGSIDAFLAKRPMFSEIGKTAIAALLLPKESPQSILHAEPRQDWYSYLWNQLVFEVVSAVDIENAQLRVVTFNYDRSLEYFLHEAARNTFGLSDNDASATARSIKITHVYGSLGDIPLGSTIRNEYTGDLSPGRLKKAANAIRVIPEARDDDQVFESCRSDFVWAEFIVFLGFGFDPLNCRRLGVSQLLARRMENSSSKALGIVASALGRTDAENDYARSLIGIPFKTYDEDCLSVLRKSRPLSG